MYLHGIYIELHTRPCIKRRNCDKQNNVINPKNFDRETAVINIMYSSLLSLYNPQLSARALVKKTQEPGIKLQKADFFRNDTWTSPQTNSEDAPKIPLVHFFNSRWPPPCNAILEKQGYTLILHLCS